MAKVLYLEGLEDLVPFVEAEIYNAKRHRQHEVNVPLLYEERKRVPEIVEFFGFPHEIIYFKDRPEMVRAIIFKLS